MSERLLEMYEDIKEKDARIAELQARVAELEAERDRLRGLCMWAAGRLLDAGDVQGHEHMLRKLEKK